MSSNNVVVVISNNAQITDFITSKLVLLRDVDRIEHTNTVEAMDCLKEQIPNSILLHCEYDDTKRFKLVKQIKEEVLLKNIPIVLILDKCTPEFAVEMFDAGVSDILTTPVQEHELLFRVMWSIQKNEAQTNLELKNQFLSNLGIIQLNTGFYTKKYCEEFLTNEVDYALEHKQNACVILLCAQNTDNEIDLGDFAQIIKKSVRLNDLVGIAEKNKYYLFLPKTKLNGAYAVFERLKQNSGMEYKITAGVVEILNKPFDKIKDALEDAIKESEGTGSVLNVASDIVKVKGANVFKKIPVIIDDETINKALSSAIKNVQQAEEEKNEQVPKENSISEQTANMFRPAIKTPAQLEQIEAEKRNAVVYRQAYERKCKLVLEPVFEKYKNLLEDASRYVFVEYKVELNQSFFKVIKGANELLIFLNYEGLSKIKIETLHVFNTRMKNSETEEIEIVELDRACLTGIFEQFIDALNNC